jgi:hypothetical protein
MEIELIYCADGNERFAEIAIKAESAPTTTGLETASC